MLAGVTPVLVHNCSDSVFYHGSDQGSLKEIWEAGLKAGSAGAKHMDGAGGFFLATEYDDAEYYALRRGGQGLGVGVIKTTITKDAMAALREAGAQLRDIPFGGQGSVHHIGQEFHIPVSAFDLYNDLRKSGGIRYSAP
ncbi:hypothetical protein ACWGQT_20790 [Streptomyces yangpuensis]